MSSNPFGRCPLRKSHREALVCLLGSMTLSRLAGKLGTNVNELDAVVQGRVAPTLMDRTSIIRELSKAQLIGRAVGDYSDPHGPGSEGLEQLGNAKEQRRYQATHAPRDRGQGDI